MRRGENEMALAINNLTFLFGIATPEQKDQMLSPLIEVINNFIGKLLPALAFVGGSFMLFDCEDAVQE